MHPENGLRHKESNEFEGETGLVVMETEQAALQEDDLKVDTQMASLPTRAWCTTSRVGAFSRALPMMSVPHGRSKEASAFVDGDTSTTGRTLEGHAGDPDVPLASVGLHAIEVPGAPIPIRSRS